MGMLMGLFSSKLEIPQPDRALPGRTDQTMPVPEHHYVNGNPMKGPFPDHLEQAVFGLGCFWGAERYYWQTPGVWSTAVGYAGGHTPNPTYEEVCSGMTGHSEVVLVVYDPSAATYEQLLTLFWETHDPTQGMRQGNDIGTQYRSVIYTTTPEQLKAAEASRTVFEKNLADAGYPAITTEIGEVGNFYYAEPYHQQYLAKVPNGYCGIGGTGVCYVEEAGADA
ncbi:MAG: peptide-methionine (S)-S-oxide reductase [Gammaproteobacteria bacterium]|nr:peptide-methionine (S)-S-oxide reductase [Gammaproteobacteria bacterium]